MQPITILKGTEKEGLYFTFEVDLEGFVDVKDIILSIFGHKQALNRPWGEGFIKSAKNYCEKEYGKMKMYEKLTKDFKERFGEDIVVTEYNYLEWCRDWDLRTEDDNRMNDLNGGKNSF